MMIEAVSLEHAFGPRRALKGVSFGVPEGILNAEFPSMMLQTLIENSIKHGLEPKTEGGRIEVSAEGARGKLRVCVLDTGAGCAAAEGAMPDSSPRIAANCSAEPGRRSTIGASERSDAVKAMIGRSPEWTFSQVMWP